MSGFGRIRARPRPVDHRLDARSLEVSLSACCGRAPLLPGSGRRAAGQPGYPAHDRHPQARRPGRTGTQPLPVGTTRRQWKKRPRTRRGQLILRCRKERESRARCHVACFTDQGFPVPNQRPVLGGLWRQAAEPGVFPRATGSALKTFVQGTTQTEFIVGSHARGFLLNEIAHDVGAGCKMGRSGAINRGRGLAGRSASRRRPGGSRPSRRASR